MQLLTNNFKYWTFILHMPHLLHVPTRNIYLSVVMTTGKYVYHQMSRLILKEKQRKISIPENKQNYVPSNREVHNHILVSHI